MSLLIAGHSLDTIMLPNPLPGSPTIEVTSPRPVSCDGVWIHSISLVTLAYRGREPKLSSSREASASNNALPPGGDALRLGGAIRGECSNRSSTDHTNPPHKPFPASPLMIVPTTGSVTTG